MKFISQLNASTSYMKEQSYWMTDRKTDMQHKTDILCHVGLLFGLLWIGTQNLCCVLYVFPSSVYVKGKSIIPDVYVVNSFTLATSKTQMKTRLFHCVMKHILAT